MTVDILSMLLTPAFSSIVEDNLLGERCRDVTLFTF